MQEGEQERISLIDVHAHLDQVEDLSNSLEEAHAAGVIGVIGVGMDVESNQKILKIAEENKGYVYRAIGYHPWELILHCRFSHQHALRIVKELKIRRAVFHWYSGPLPVLEEILATGFFISATPALRYSPPHQEAIKRTPLERILLETDAPVIYQGKESRPRDVRITLGEVARLKGLDPSEVSRQTTSNASRFFGVPFGPEIE